MILAVTGRFRHFLWFGVAKRRQWFTVALAAVFAGVAGCASVPGIGGLSRDSPAEAKEKAVTARAQARWDALIKGDVDTAYGYLSPASRAVTPLEQFKARTRTGSFRSVKIEKVSCSGEACEVSLLLTYDHRLMAGITTPVGETWIIEDGQAWYVYRL